MDTPNFAIVDNQLLLQTINEINKLSQRVEVISAELAGSKKRYLNIAEAIEFTGLSKSTLHKYKEEIGYSRPGGVITFRRNDVEDFMEETFLKVRR